MKPALQLRLHQQLALTPQLQQAIRLLQLSGMELEAELNQMMEANPLLELEETTPNEPSSVPQREDAPKDTNTGDTADPSADLSIEITTSSAETEASPFDFNLASREYRGNNNDEDMLEPQDADVEDLRDHLLWQLNLTPMSARDSVIAATIIDAINDDGYLSESIEAIRNSLASQAVSDKEIEAIRHRLQHFDPLGAGSRTLSECLLVQLGVLVAETPGLAVARQLVASHLETLATNDRAKLCQKLNTTPDKLDDAIALVRSLSPKPGVGYSNAPPEYVAPDVYAYKSQQRWQVSLAPDCQPRLAINQHYASLIARAQRDDATYLRGQLQEARWLIKSLQTRAETLLKVAEAIVQAQTSFLEFGPEAMRPLVLKEVAETIGMHESTVSRVTTRKYLHTPRGTFEFKYFFSSGVATKDGGVASSTAIQAMIRKLIGAEQPAHPLSDLALATELNRHGIRVARRTVAKYREAMHILSSNERCRFS